MTGKMKVLRVTFVMILFLFGCTANADGHGDGTMDMDAENGTWKAEKRAVVVRMGESNTISCTLDGEKVSGVSWATGDPAIASVDGNGTIHGLTKGTTTVTASYNGKERVSVPVHVDREALPPLGPVAEPRFAFADGVYVNPDAEKTNSAVLMLTGDLMCMSSQQNAVRSGDIYNFNASFDYVKPIFAQADFVMGNLETMLSQTAPYTSEQGKIYAPSGGKPNCNAPATYLDAVCYAGFDAVVTANNHNLDTGVQGIFETLDNLASYKLPQTGIFASAEHERFLIFDINGIRVALLSYSTLYT